MKQYIQLILLSAMVACNPPVSQEVSMEYSKAFNDYWYAGEAEISSYDLQQARYGEIHSGKAVLVFVTEPFSESKQVKLDDWREENVSVMKLNMTKKFITGIYPYSMMMSTFIPVLSDQYPDALKVTTSSQEWCGHTWTQLNLAGETYHLKGFSYFESEGDVDVSISNAILEDELWTRIRLNPETLPTGKHMVLPSTFYLRLRHRKNEPVEASMLLKEVQTSTYDSVSHLKYSIAYSDRSIEIYFEKAFPHTILGWEETYMSGFGSPEELTTRAKRINTIQSAYWGKNHNQDRQLRKELGLTID